MPMSQADINALFTGAKIEMIKTYDEYVPDFTGCYQEIPSQAAREGYVVTAASGSMERLSEAKQHMGKNFTKTLYVENGEPWAKFLEVSESDIEDKTALNLLSQQAVDLGIQAKALDDDLLVSLLQNGTSIDWVDGQQFFDASHPVNPWGAFPGTWSNLLTGTALTASNFEAARKNLLARKGWNGRAMKLRGELQLWVPTDLEPTAMRIVGQEFSSDPGVTTAGGNTNINFNKAVVKHMPCLNDEPTVWYLALVTPAAKPIGLQVKRALRFEDNAGMDSRMVDEIYRQKVSRRVEYVPLNAHLITRCVA
jgi:phage major head subunit gpT-like protein